MIFVSLSSTLFMRCTDDDFITEGMAPIYISYDDVSSISREAPRPFVNLGKIVASSNYIFINEENKGIHVIDNTNPNLPVVLHFWKITGNREFTIVDNVLYADNGRDLLLIDISDFNNITFIRVVKNVYAVELQEIAPPNYQGWFECYRPELGTLAGWEKKRLINPLCEKR